MKIKVKDMTLAEALAEPRAKHRPPVKPAPFFRWLLKTVSAWSGWERTSPPSSS